MLIRETVPLAGANTAPILSWGDVGATLLMLMVVLAVIIGLALLAKRFNLGMPRQGKQLVRVLSTTMVSTKERVVVVKAGESLLLLGVTAHSVNLIKELPAEFEAELLKEKPTS